MPTNGWDSRRTADSPSVRQPSLSSTGDLEFLWKPTSLVLLILLAGGISVIIAFAQAREFMEAVIYFGLYAFLILGIGLMTLTILWVSKHRLVSWRPVSIAALASGIAIALSVILTLGSHAIWTDWSAMQDAGPGFLLVRSLAISTAICTTSIIAMNNHLIARQSAARAKQAELDALRARVNPHFLFNTLNTATALLHDQPDQAERVLLDLSDLFRAALSENEVSTLHQEIELTRRYLEIEALRLSTRLDATWHLPQPLPSINVPTLALQALVENAVHHGIEANTGPTQLLIRAEETATEVILRVENTLPEAPSTAHNGHRVGLAASQARIDAMTYGEGSLRTHVENGRFIAEIRLPTQSPVGRD